MNVQFLLLPLTTPQGCWCVGQSVSFQLSVYLRTSPRPFDDLRALTVTRSRSQSSNAVSCHSRIQVRGASIGHRCFVSFQDIYRRFEPQVHVDVRRLPVLAGSRCDHAHFQIEVTSVQFWSRFSSENAILKLGKFAILARRV